MRRSKVAIILGVLLLLVALGIGIWLAMSGGSGWLCCITNPANGIETCVQVQGIDSECKGGDVGWCKNISEDATGVATCLDR